MGNIRVLSELVANKIAAGEVVERPASVVKELIENSLDAGASSISVAVRHGGKSLIRVRDNGQGMDPDDVAACLLRHATSKLSDADALPLIETLGFRGEALPSIASVSRLTLISRLRGSETATVARVCGGATESVSECTAEPGTTVEVADLFFNTPARKKFLKSDAAEYNAIAEVFSTQALSRPDVSFRITRNDVEAAAYPSCSDLLKRIAQLHDTGFCEHLYPLSIDRSEIRITGYIGSPDTTRVNRTGQKFFINGRPVQSPALSTALSRAYDEFLQGRRFPVAVLFLEIERSLVDVNVHPTKREVRMRTERFFQDTLARCVRQVLRDRGVRPEPPPFSAPPPPSQKQRYVPDRPPVCFSRLKEAAAPWRTGSSPAQADPPGAAGTSPGPQQGRSDARQAPLSGLEPPSNPFGVVRVLGQIIGTYIVAETAEGLAVFDQHAAHERILYEQLMDAAAEKSPSSQTALFPATLHLDLREASIMQQYADNFNTMGFSINHLGGNTFAIDGVPACMPDIEAARVIKDTLHEVMERTEKTAWESRQQELAAVLACKTYAVKGGMSLELQEMEHLIQQLGTRKNPHVCPHGRPVCFLLERDEIERRVKRK